MDEIVNPIDLVKITKKDYKNFTELRTDIAWFAHNCITKYSNRQSNSAKDIVKAAKKIVGGIEQEIQNLILCPECYKNAFIDPENSFMVPCQVPHILLWTNCDQYGYWPAKLMKYDDNNMVFVRFFGDYTNACIASSNCFIFSREIPENKYSSCVRGGSFELALRVSFVE